MAIWRFYKIDLVQSVIKLMIGDVFKTAAIHFGFGLTQTNHSSALSGLNYFFKVRSFKNRAATGKILFTFLRSPSKYLIMFYRTTTVSVYSLKEHIWSVQALQVYSRWFCFNKNVLCSSSAAHARHGVWIQVLEQDIWIFLVSGLKAKLNISWFIFTENVQTYTKH